MVLHLIVHMKSNQNSCEKNEKGEPEITIRTLCFSPLHTCVSEAAPPSDIDVGNVWEVSSPEKLNYSLFVQTLKKTCRESDEKIMSAQSVSLA